MLSTNLPWIVSAVSAFFAILAALVALSCRRHAIASYQYVSEQNKRSIGLKRLSELEAEMTEVVDSVTALHVSLKKLRARIGMRHNRDLKPNGADGLPDPLTDPDGWKRAMRLRLHMEKRHG